MTAAYLRDIRATIWKPAPGPDSAIGSYFGQPVPGSTIIEGVRIQFSVEKDNKTTANNATVTISNLSQRTRDELADVPRRMILEAGHGGKLSTLFVGDVTAPPGVAYDSVDNEITLLGKDGGRALKHARVNKAYRGTPTALKLAQEAIAAMGLRDPENLSSYQELRQQYPHGANLYGLASDQLTELLKPFKLGWSIQNGKLVVGKADEILDSDTILIDASAGMIGSPQLTPPKKAGGKPTLTLQCLLFPELAPNRRVQVVSRFVSGTFKINGVKHSGDNFGGDQLTEIEATPV